MSQIFVPNLPSKDAITDLIIDLVGVAPEEIVALKRGAWSDALRIDVATREYVLRFSTTEEDFRCDANAARFANSRLPIPVVHDIGRLGDLWWCFSNFVSGKHIDDLSNVELQQIIPSLADMLISMRLVEDPTTHSYGGWDAHGNGQFATFAEQLLDVSFDTDVGRGSGWSIVLKEHPVEQRIFDQGIATMEQLCRYIPDDRHLIHADTLNFNIKADQRTITGIFDWGCAMWGDALYDLAWIHFWEAWYPQWQAVHYSDQLQHLVGMHGDHMRERMQCYLLHIGLMHIRYNALIRNATAMREVAQVTEALTRLST